METIEKNKITYLLGAGASALALPTVLEYSDRLMNMSSILTDLQSRLNQELQGLCKELSSNLYFVAQGGRKYNSVDAYAKHCFTDGRVDELNMIKKTLSSFFSIRQFVYGEYDSRYNHFISDLTTATNRKHIFNPNIKILNWNYDFQIQKAGNIYKPELKLEDDNYLISYYPKTPDRKKTMVK